MRSASARCGRRSTRSRRPATANGVDRRRHHIAHIQVIHPDDIGRFRTLGVAANMQPLWACHEGQMDRLTLPFLGAERGRWQYPFESLRRAGAVLVGGSDWAVSTPDPLLEIEVAVNRVWYESRGRVAAVPAGAAAGAARCARRVHDRHGLREPPRRRDRHARAGQARRHRRPRPGPVRSRGRARSARRGWSRRSSGGDRRVRGPDVRG